jgi:hypothetical protein
MVIVLEVTVMVLPVQHACIQLVGAHHLVLESNGYGVRE